MAETYEFQGHRVEIKRKSFRRNLTLAVNPRGYISVSANKGYSWKEIEKFLFKNRDWITKGFNEINALKEKNPQRKFNSGEIYPYLGREYRLVFKVGDRVGLEFHEEKMIFQAPIEDAAMSVEQRAQYFECLRNCYQQTARKIINSRVSIYSEKMQLFPNRVNCRGQRSIWGSCSSENNLSFNWKVIVAPLQVVDYLVVHELSHIKHRNHGPLFWALVEKTLPNIEKSKKWLKEHHYAGDFLMRSSELWG